MTNSQRREQVAIECSFQSRPSTGFSLFKMFRGHLEKGERKSKKSEDYNKCCKISFSVHDRDITTIISQQLWLSTHDLLKIKAISLLSWMGEGLRSPHSLLKNYTQSTQNQFLQECGSVGFPGSISLSLTHAHMDNNN